MYKVTQPNNPIETKTDIMINGVSHEIKFNEPLDIHENTVELLTEAGFTVEEVNEKTEEI